MISSIFMFFGNLELFLVVYCNLIQLNAVSCTYWEIECCKLILFNFIQTATFESFYLLDCAT